MSGSGGLNLGWRGQSSPEPEPCSVFRLRLQYMITWTCDHGAIFTAVYNNEIQLKAECCIIPVYIEKCLIKYSPLRPHLPRAHSGLGLGCIQPSVVESTHLKTLPKKFNVKLKKWNQSS